MENNLHKLIEPYTGNFVPLTLAIFQVPSWFLSVKSWHLYEWWDTVCLFYRYSIVLEFFTRKILLL